MRHHPLRPTHIALAATLALAYLHAPAQTVGTASSPVRISIQAQPLAEALNEWARQTRIQLIVQQGLVQGKTAPAVSGNLTPIQALDRLLAGSGLVAMQEGRAVVVKTAPVVSSTATLAPVTVTANAERETATGPVNGYVAKRSASATKTDTSIIETPQSITVVTSDQINDQKAQSVADSLTYTPGVSMQSAGFSRMVDDFMIRGFNVGNGNLGMLRDGMKYQSNVYDGGMEPYGLERIEVVRGAASVLYGQLTPGGLVNAVSKRPTDTPLHEINLEYGSNARKQISADFSGPLDDEGVWSYRLTGLKREADNWVDQVQDDKTYLAPALTWQPSSKTRLTLLATYQSVKTRFSAPLLYSDVANGTIARNRFVGEPDFDRYESVTKTIGYELEHRFDNGAVLRSAARSFDAEVKWDYMMANLTPVSNGTLYRLASKRNEHSTGQTADNSIELNFDTGAVKHTLLTGVDYYRRTYDSHRYRGTSYLALDVDDPVYSGSPTINTVVDRGSDNVGEQTGFYLQDQARLGNWVLTGGTRYDSSNSESRSYQTGKLTSQSDEAVTSRAGIVYLAPSGVAPYLSFSQSFQPQVGTDSLTAEAFTPSRGRQMEVGVRYAPPESGLLLSGAVYDLKQSNVVTSDASGNQYQQGQVLSRGAELEARWQGKIFGLIAAYAYTDAKVTESRLASEVNEQLAMTPRHAASVWGNMELGQLGLPGLRAGLGVRYIGSNNLPGYDSDVPAYTLVDAMLSYKLGALSSQLRGVTLTLNARNLFDRDYFTCASYDGCRYGEPRTVTATVNYRW
jgi:iron complex outermembrane recepter protein